MKKYLLISLLFGVGIAQTSSAYSPIKSIADIDRLIWELSTEEQRAERLKEDLVKKRLATKPNVKIGMTTNQVLNNSNWGEPKDRNTTINEYGKFEQWIYGNSKYLYFKNGKLTSIQY